MGHSDPVTVSLNRIAHGRTGDKGNRANISLIAYRPEFYSVLQEQVTVERVRELFAHRGVTRVVRYELPLLAAMNFVIDDVLEGGVNGSLNLDGLSAKSAPSPCSTSVYRPTPDSGRRA